MIEIEIKGHYGQFIKGFLRRVVEDKGVIVYADDLTLEETIPLNELRLPQKVNYETMSLVQNQRIEALLPLNLEDNSRDNSFTEALANLKIQPSATSSRLANPFACLTCASWWPCIVTKTRDDHAVVLLSPIIPEVNSGTPKEYTELAASLNTITEICERKMLRPASVDVPCLRPDSFFSHKIDIPQELFQYASDPSVHESMLQHCNGPASIMIENDQIIILSPSEEVIRIASLLEEMHVRMLRQKWAILRYISATKRSHDAMLGSKDGQQSSADANTWSSDEGYFVESFQVPSFLMGLAIGTQGSNIRAARSLPGIIRIDVKEASTGAPRNGIPWGQSTVNAPADVDSASPGATTPEDEAMATFKIVAESEEKAKAARSMLEFCRLCLLVPHRLIGRVLGMRTTNILAINEKSGVKHIHLEEDTVRLPIQVDENISEDPEHHPSCLRIEDIHPDLANQYEHGAEGGFFIIGTRDAVEKARILISFQIDGIFELEKLEAEKINLLREFPPREPRSSQEANGGYRENGPRRGRGSSMMGGRGQESRSRDSGPTNYQQTSHYQQPGSGDPYDEISAASGGRGGFIDRGRRGGMRGNRWNGPQRSAGDFSDQAGFESTDNENHGKPSDSEQIVERRGGGRGKDRRPRRSGHVTNGGGRRPEMNGTGAEDSNGDHVELPSLPNGSEIEHMKTERAGEIYSEADVKEVNPDTCPVDSVKSRRRTKKAQTQQQQQ